jgi:thioredoxin-related protein
MVRFLWLLLCLPIAGNAQENGIQFEHDLTWQQVFAKAKGEGKYIFVDCFASWCAPCKEMDKTVYLNDTITEYMNARFISVKVQMDTSKADNAQMQNWYETAHNLQQQYQVTAYPSYLFFSPDGAIVHRGLGYKTVAEFLALAKNAMNPKKAFYSLLEAYRRGIRDYASMQYLSTTCGEIGDRQLATSIAQDYIDNYLLTLSKEELYTGRNIEFMAANIRSSGDRSFNLFFRHGDSLDIKVRPGYSRDVIDYVIWKEEIKPFLDAAKNGGTPDWKASSKSIQKKYGFAYADRTILDAKLRWYKAKRIWPLYIENVIYKVEKYGSDGNFGIAFNLNNYAWDIFKYSTNKEELIKALKWSDSTIKIDPAYVNSYDTYANLLYKLGRVDQAILMEEKAKRLDPKNADIDETISKMKQREKTWTDESQ